MTQPTPVPTPPAGDPQPADSTPAQTAPTSVAGDSPRDDKPLGPAGERALAAEREARKELEKRIAALAPLRKLAEALGTGTPDAAGKSEVELLNERFAEHERTVAEERAARWRAEVAHEKGLTPQQAGRLRGGTREELAADADALRELFPVPPPPGPRIPAPDPGQGPRPGGTQSDEDALYESIYGQMPGK